MWPLRSRMPSFFWFGFWVVATSPQPPYFPWNCPLTKQFRPTVFFGGGGELYNKTSPRRAFGTQKTKRKPRPAIRRSARWRARPTVFLAPGSLARRKLTPPPVGPWFRRNFISRCPILRQNQTGLPSHNPKPTPAWLGGGIARSDANPHPGPLSLGR